MKVGPCRDQISVAMIPPGPRSSPPRPGQHRRPAGYGVARPRLGPGPRLAPGFGLGPGLALGLGLGLGLELGLALGLGLALARGLGLAAGLGQAPPLGLGSGRVLADRLPQAARLASGLGTDPAPVTGAPCW
jgi:hypothetical protein